MKHFKATLSRIKSGVESFIERAHPAKIVALGYMMYMTLGWLALNLPFMSTIDISALDNLFIAVSAVSTTGLVTVDVGTAYTFIGQVVVLLLIQLGGIGYMTFGSFVILSRHAPMTSQREQIGRTVFSLPESFRIDKFVVSVIKFTIVIETLGAIALYFLFREAASPQPLWQAIFHSISAFCTAGFSLMSTSFMGFASNFWMNFVIGVLSYMGAIGFIVWVDYWRKFRGKVEQVTLTSKIILWSTLWLSLAGAAIIFFSEPIVTGQPLESRLLQALFQSMTAVTTVGFNTIETGTLANASLLIVIMLMVVGASPSGTGGGLKSTTFSALFGLMKSALRGRQEVTFWGKAIPQTRVWSAVSSLMFYVTFLLIGTLLLELTQISTFAGNLFEAASALGTVGLSTGVTPALTSFGKIVVIALMYCGRLGPLTFSIAMFFRKSAEGPSSDSDLAV